MRFYGKVGYVDYAETSPGVYEEQAIERNYYGDIVKNASKWENSSGVNDNVIITNVVSILADPYAYEHFACMRYVEFMGALWEIRTIEVERPRIKITLGGLYNGQ